MWESRAESKELSFSVLTPLFTRATGSEPGNKQSSYQSIWGRKGVGVVGGDWLWLWMQWEGCVEDAQARGPSCLSPDLIHPPPTQEIRFSEPEEIH